MRFITKLAARLVRLSDRVFRDSHSPLLRGDLRAYAESEYPPEKYPTAWKDIPADLRRPLIWDGRLLNGRRVAELARAHITDEMVGTALTKAGVRAVVVIALLAAVVFYGAFQNIGRGFYDLTPYPRWAAENGAWLPVVSWYALTAFERVWMIASQTITAVIPLALLFPVVWFFAFSRGMTRLWDGLSAELRIATRDERIFWKANQMTRELQYLAYCREVEQATGRLSEQPFIPVGRASGTMRSRGDMEAPDIDQLVGFDGESIRQHTLVLGGTGSGKTRLAIRPLFRRIMTADWGKGHRIGAYVTDGKGTLWRDLMPMVADRTDIAILGTQADHFGIDLTEGMTPLEIATTFKAVSGQVAGRSSDDFWPESASLLLMHSATVARALEMHEETVKEWIEKRHCRPYSLLGIAVIASEESATNEVAARLRDIGLEISTDADDERVAEILEAYASAEWLMLSFLELAKETRSSIIANVNVVLGKLSGAREISRRFCAGNFGKTVDVDHALKGGVLMVAVGETEHGMAGKVVTTWLKTRLYIMARRRLLSDPDGCRTTSCAMFADEFQLLATTGPDSDSTFWNIARETGVFMIAATQSLAALQQVIGPDATANLVNLLRSKIILKTEELSTVRYAVELAGLAPRGWEYESDFYATQTAREKAVGNGGNGSVSFGWFGGIIPSRFRPSTAPGSAYSTPLEYFKLLNKEDRGLQLRMRQEDRNRAAMVEGVQMQPKLSTDEMLLGSGLAFAVIQRAGGDRTDIIDLDIAA